MTDTIEVLKKVKDTLIEHFGEDIHDVIPFGSGVSGKAHDNSDYDILIIRSSKKPSPTESTHDHLRSRTVYPHRIQVGESFRSA